MLIKKLSKIGLSLILAASFFIAYPFNARADFTSTDSTNLRNVAEDTSNIYTRVGTTNTHLNNINTKLTNIYNDVGSIKNAVTNTIATTVNTISTTLTSIKGYVDGIEGYIDGVESKLDDVIGSLATSNSNWVTLGNYIDAMYQTMQTSDTTSTNIYNLLNTYTNNYISSIDKATAIIQDNLLSFRYKAYEETVNLTTLSGQSVSYKTQKFGFYTYSYTAENGIQNTYLERYANFRGMFFAYFNSVSESVMAVGNMLRSYLNVLTTDTGYIGTELHLTYQLINTFKSNFDTFVNYWKLAFKQIYVLIDNITTPRVSNTADTITLNTFDGTISYTLKRNDVNEIIYNSETKSFQKTLLERYSNFSGSLWRYHFMLSNYFWAYFSYLNESRPAESITNSVAALDQNLSNYSAAEQQIQNRVQNALSTFIPDLSLLSGFVAIAWCSQYLQRVYVALGSYGTVIMIGLLLGVCMQFIGYFRYKY